MATGIPAVTALTAVPIAQQGKWTKKQKLLAISCALAAVAAVGIYLYQASQIPQDHKAFFIAHEYQSPVPLKKMPMRLGACPPGPDILILTKAGNFSNGHFHLPTFLVRNANDDLNWSNLVEDGLFYTKKAHEEIFKLPQITINTKKEADEIVQKLRTIHFASWDYEFTGCDRRASVAMHFLRGMGVAEESLVQQFIKCSDPNIKSPPIIGTEMVRWKYHTAASTRLSDGSLVILDPTLDPMNSLTLAQWIKKMTINSELVKKCIHSTSLLWNRVLLNWNSTENGVKKIRWCQFDQDRKNYKDLQNNNFDFLRSLF